MLERNYTICNSQGLHARPASLLVQLASQSKSNVSILKNGKEYNAKSILGVMSVGASKGEEIILRIDGPDELETDAKIAELFANNLGE